MENWEIGKTKLRKTKGHEFIGTLRTIFTTGDGNTRIVVESTVPGALGLLFIFRPDQMEEVL
jgi:hypothetical protein